MKNLFEKEFGHKKFIIGCIHTLALPGTPFYDPHGGMKKIIAQAKQEAVILEDAGFHAVLYTNESDMPYQTKAPAEVVAAMSTVINEVQQKVSLPHGVNILVDPQAALCIAHATGARFIRGFVSGTMVGDFGSYCPDGAGLLRLRKLLGAEKIHIIANITPGFSINLDTRPVEEKARGAVFMGLADAVCIGGSAAGQPITVEFITQVAHAVADTPVVIGTGTTVENVAELSQAADAFIVGTSLKVDGQTLAPIDPQRARKFMEQVNAILENG
ncbi:MAG TPA: BtpA/SgcQ family protein [Deltaproteobacteria bacterium]|nr:MAG: SgcQ protein [Deltaproteobacteria bacterium]HDM77747.1 BtpA/SgcQ family protein [Deltaproteobacteria bacterium]